MSKKLQKNYDDLQRRYNTVVKAVDTLVLQAEQKDNEIAALKTQCESADERVLIYKKVVEDNLLQTQAEKDDLIKEIMLLKKKIKELGG